MVKLISSFHSALHVMKSLQRCQFVFQEESGLTVITMVNMIMVGIIMKTNTCSSFFEISGVKG